MQRRRAFCIMSLRVALDSEAKSRKVRSRSESEFQQGVKLSGADAKPGDLRMGRLKDG